MAAVALVFAPLAPLVAATGAVVFWLSSWVYKYQLLFVFVSKVESGGVSAREQISLFLLMCSRGFFHSACGTWSLIGYLPRLC